MELANIILRLLSASQVLLFIAALALSANPLRLRLIGCLLMFCAFSYLVVPLYYDYIGQFGLFIFWLPAAITPSFLLLFFWLLFEENAAIPRWIIVVVLVSILFTLMPAKVYAAWVGSEYAAIPPQLIKIINVGLAIYVVWRGRDADLVELRLKLRNLFVIVLAVLVLSIVSAELLTNFDVPKAIEIFGMAIIFISALLFNLNIIRGNPTLKMVGGPVVPRDNSDDAMIQKLLQRMQAERLYANHDLRVAGLADTLGVPEYQLRKRINQKLGYRNFNQFVNRYRIEEAGTRLLKNPHTPVLTIALDVGFRSISSFNTAFQAQFGVSPTQYRTNA